MPDEKVTIKIVSDWRYWDSVLLVNRAYKFANEHKLKVEVKAKAGSFGQELATEVGKELLRIGLEYFIIYIIKRMMKNKRLKEPEVFANEEKISLNPYRE